eukprot:5823440-Prymnesium_polylepis.1
MAGGSNTARGPYNTDPSIWQVVSILAAGTMAAFTAALAPRRKKYFFSSGTTEMRLAWAVIGSGVASSGLGIGTLVVTFTTW